MRGINLGLSGVESVTYFADGQSLLIAWMPTRLPGDLLNFLGWCDEFFRRGKNWSPARWCAMHLLAGGKYINMCSGVSLFCLFRGRRLVEGNLFRGLLPEERLKWKCACTRSAARYPHFLWQQKKKNPLHYNNV